MSEKSSFTVVKELSGLGLGIVAFLYVCGYLVHIVYFRLLGVQVGVQPLTYLTLSGDYLASLFLSILQLFSLRGLYGPKLIEHALWPAVLLCVISLVCIFLRKRFPGRLFSAFVCTVVAVSCLFLISAEFKVLRVQRTLQPFSANEIENSSELDLTDDARSTQGRSRLIKEAYEEHQRLGVNGPGFAEWYRWFNPLNPNNGQERTGYYLALLLLNLLFFAMLGFGVWLRKTGAFAKVLLVQCLISLLVLLLLLPCVYATLGRVFSFPVVALRLKLEDATLVTNGASTIQSTDQSTKGKDIPSQSQSKEMVTHPVFLIFYDDTQVVVYDRMSRFQLKTIPRSRLLDIAQLYESSPFDDCSLRGQFVPCETKWLTESSIIVDF